jgi:hypothetical protein
MDIKHSFVLISDFEDLHIPQDSRNTQFTKDIFNKIYNNMFMVSWYAINYNYDPVYKKIHNLPLGLDFHTMSTTNKWGGNRTSSSQQEDKLIKQYIKSNQIKYRKHKCFLCSNNNTSKSLKNIGIIDLDRNDIKQKLMTNKYVDICNNSYSRDKFWEKLCEYRFIICPVGNGMDTHRLWESLFLGCIVIVQSCGLDNLMEEFPVVILKDFNQITEENLNKWFKKYKHMCNDPNIKVKYYNKYWLDKMHKSLTVS